MGSGLDYVSAETACRSPQQVHVWAPYVTSGVSAGTGASGGVSAGGTGALVLRLPGGGAGEQPWSLAVGDEGKGRLILQHLLRSVPLLCRCSGALS